MTCPAPMIAVQVTAAELRALVGFHDQMADAYTCCEQYVEGQDAEARAVLLRRLVDEVEPPAADEADDLLGPEDEL